MLPALAIFCGVTISNVQAQNNTYLLSYIFFSQETGHGISGFSALQFPIRQQSKCPL